MRPAASWGTSSAFGLSWRRSLRCFCNPRSVPFTSHPHPFHKTRQSAAQQTIQDNTMRHNVIQYNTTQHNAMQCNITHCATTRLRYMPYNNTLRTIQYNTEQYNAMHCDAMQCHTMRCNTIEFRRRQAIQYNVIRYDTIEAPLQSLMQCYVLWRKVGLGRVGGFGWARIRNLCISLGTSLLSMGLTVFRAAAPPGE